MAVDGTLLEFMPVNIEIKAKVRDFDSVRERAESISEAPVEKIIQSDTFFNSSRGRLKMRVLAPDRAQLIFYERPDQNGPKRSEYHICQIDNPGVMLDLLSMALGVRGVVTKTRYLYKVDQTRIHLDTVSGLGQFVELEVVLGEGQNDDQGRLVAEALMAKLEINPEDLVEGAYMDLLESE